MATARILIVDDELEILNLVSRVLKNSYEVISASNPRNALEIVRTNPRIDLVLSDFEMPEMRGPDLLNEVKRISPSMAVLLMSGNDEIETRLPASIPFLKKPFSPRELHASVEAALAVAHKLSADLKKELEKATTLLEQNALLSCELSDGIRKSAAICEKSRVMRKLKETPSAPSTYPDPAHGLE
jgi:DNA-binding NtrC family response regulator